MNLVLLSIWVSTSDNFEKEEKRQTVITKLKIEGFLIDVHKSKISAAS